MDISMTTADRYFQARLHFAIFEEEQIIAAGFVGVPEAVSAISAGILETRPVMIEGMEFRRGSDTFRRIERKIGLGDVSHGIVYNSLATIQGLNDLLANDESNRGYIIAPDGNMDEALSHYVINRFGLPFEWKAQYPHLFDFMCSDLQVITNPAFVDVWPNIRAVRFNGNETDVLDVMEMALKNRMLLIPQSDVHGSFDPKWTLKEYMINNAVAMSRKLQEFKPRHTAQDKLDPAIAQMERVPFPAQAHVIQGLVNGLEHESSVITSANMGTGKSLQAVGVVNVLHQRKRRNQAKRGTAVLLSAPGITLSKWEKKEIKQTLPKAKTQIIRTSEEAIQLLNKVRNGYRPQPDAIEFTIIGIDKAKMNSEPYYAGIWKRVAGSLDEYGWHCPDCGRQLMKKEEGEWIPLEWFDIAEGLPPSSDAMTEARLTKSLLPNGLPKGFKVKWKRSKRFTRCSYFESPHGSLQEGETDHLCGTKLYRPAVKSRGETRNRPRYNISRIFKKMKKYFDLYIADEVHQAKASGSGRGDAFAQMVKAAKKSLLLTGTLVNGKSSSIKEILWRTDAKTLLEKGFDDTTGDIAWAERFGKVKQIVFLTDDVNEQGWVTRQRRKPAQPTEEPGIAPHMTAEFLLHKTAFLDLDDLGLPLVEIKEKPVFITMDEEHGAFYRTFHDAFYDECRRRSITGAKGVWSKFIPATINYADRPDLGAFYEFNDGTCVTAPKLEGYHAKERWLIDTVKQELAENRGVVIYNNYTGTYEMNQRTQQILKEHGIDSRILDESNTEKRSEILAKLEEEGAKVVITNMKLVEVGLDLLAWPTLIFNQLSYEVNVFRQAAKRSHRIGQHRECRVFIPVYNGTQQMAQFKKIMAARGHALMTEGRLDRSELAKYSYDEVSSLASDLAQCFANANVADSWEELAAKEYENIEMVEESQFKQVLAERMTALADETRRLCGVPAKVIPLHQTEAEMPQEAVGGDDFNLFNLDIEEMNTSSEQEEQQMEIFDFIQVVDINRYKRKKSKKTPSESQLAFNF